jgi:hypothetical protein
MCYGSACKGALRALAELAAACSRLAAMAPSCKCTGGGTLLHMLPAAGGARASSCES